MTILEEGFYAKREGNIRHNKWNQKNNRIHNNNRNSHNIMFNYLPYWAYIISTKSGGFYGKRTKN